MRVNKEGGPGSGPHKSTTDEAIDRYNEKIRAKRAQKKEVSEPAKWDRCVHDVKKKGTAYNPYAVCTAQLQSEECPKRKMPFHEVFAAKKQMQAIGASGSPGKALARAGVKKI
jgi:hypothetical protein